MPVHLVHHPVAQDALLALRDKTTRPSHFRRLAYRLSMILTVEATRKLPMIPARVDTPLEGASGEMLKEEVVVVPVLRAGLGMVEAVLELLPHARVGHIGLQRDERTAIASQYYSKLPPDLSNSTALVVDPMLATGGSAIAAISVLQNAGARDIRLICIVAAPEGVAAVEAAHPGVHIYTPVVDRELNAQKYHPPGVSVTLEIGCMARSDAPGGGGTRTRAPWQTALTLIEPNRILVRGYRLDEMMGRLNFGEAIYLLLTGELPTPSMGRLVDAMLVSFLDHGATPPSTIAARNTATTGSSIRSAVAAGVLGFGRYYGGDVLLCRQILDQGLAIARNGVSIAEAASQVVAKLVDTHEMPPPGFGHRYHSADPRAIRLLQIAHELEADHEYSQMIRAIEHALREHPALVDRPLPVNIDGAIAAVSGDIGLPPEVADALLIISRVPGLAAHALEEQGREKPMRPIDPTSHGYDGPSERRLPDRRK